MADSGLFPNMNPKSEWMPDGKEEWMGDTSKEGWMPENSKEPWMPDGPMGDQDSAEDLSMKAGPGMPGPYREPRDEPYRGAAPHRLV